MALPSLTRAIQYDVHARQFRTMAPAEDAGARAHDAEHLLWLDLKRPSEEEMAQLAAAFGLYPLAVEDALHGHQRPKIEEYDAFFLLVFYDVALGAPDAPLRASEIRLFVGAHYLITIHDDDLPCIGEAERRWTRNPQQVEWGIGILPYSLLDTVVDQYFPGRISWWTALRR
jgi:magnesium transporter